MSFSVGLDVLKLLIFLVDTRRCVEARRVVGRHDEVSVAMGKRSSVGGTIQRLEFGDQGFSG